MKIEISTANPLEHATPALVIGCFEDAQDDLFTACDAALDGCLGRLAASREFSGKVNTTRLLHTLGKLPAERLLLVGLGKRAELDDERLRQAAGNAVQALRSARVASFAAHCICPPACLRRWRRSAKGRSWAATPSSSTRPRTGMSASASRG